MRCRLLLEDEIFFDHVFEDAGAGGFGEWGDAEGRRIGREDDDEHGAFGEVSSEGFSEVALGGGADAVEIFWKKMRLR